MVDVEDIFEMEKSRSLCFVKEKIIQRRFFKQTKVLRFSLKNVREIADSYLKKLEEVANMKIKAKYRLEPNQLPIQERYKNKVTPDYEGIFRINERFVGPFNKEPINLVEYQSDGGILKGEFVFDGDTAAFGLLRPYNENNALLLSIEIKTNNKSQGKILENLLRKDISKIRDLLLQEFSGLEYCSDYIDE